MVQIKLDKVREIKLGLYELENYENETGIPFLSVDLSKLKISDMYVFLWAGLSSTDKTLTIESVKELAMKHSNILEIYKAVNSAIAETMPIDDGKKPKN